MPMSEAVTVPRLTMMTSIVSEESLARDTHAQTHDTDTVSVIFLKICKVIYDFANKNNLTNGFTILRKTSMQKEL